MKIFRKIKGLFCKKQEEFEYTPRVEKDTICDKCEFLERCKSQNNVIDCTSLYDTRQHHTRNIGGFCIARSRI